MATLLLIAVFLPLVGALLPAENRQIARRCALVVTLLTLAAAAVLIALYPAGDTDFAITDVSWLGAHGASFDVRFSLALDGLSLWLFGLTALLMVVAVLVGWEAVEERATPYYRLLLALETGVLGVFVARDIILFYLFFEFTLLPLFFLIGIWGGRQRQYAAVKLLLFALAGSLLTLLGLLAIVLWDYHHGPAATMTFSIGQLTANLAARPIDDPALSMGIFLALFAGFAVRVPLFPLHTWLPPAQVEAPGAVGVILAAVLLKIGVYGLLRFGLPMLPQAAVTCMPCLMWLSVAAVVYAALAALAQSDLKRLIAYASVSQMGLCTLGIFALNRPGVQGGVLQMISHGLSAGGLLAIAGMLYERYHTQRIADLGGLARRTPVLASFALLFTLSSIGVPGLSGFVAELLVLLGTFQRAWTDAAWSGQYLVICVLAAAGIVLGAWYMLRLIHQVFFGPVRGPKNGDRPPVRDLCAREVYALLPLAVFVVWIGVQPKFFLDRISPTLNHLTQAACGLAPTESNTPEETNP